jgi:cytochrome c556
MQKSFRKSFGRGCVATACGGTGIAALVLAAGCAALGQDQSAATAADAIFSRKIVMDTINNRMDELEGMLASEDKLDLVEAREHADLISVMFMAFPHLFPPGTNQWKPNVERDAGRDTYASPDVWTNFADFYGRAGRASKVAYAASRAKQQSEFRTLIAELRTACNACHAVYLKTD